MSTPQDLEARLDRIEALVKKLIDGHCEVVDTLKAVVDLMKDIPTFSPPNSIDKDSFG